MGISTLSDSVKAVLGARPYRAMNADHTHSTINNKPSPVEMDPLLGLNTSD